MGFAIGQLASKPAAIFNLSSWALVNNINANKLYNKIVSTFGAGVYAINRNKSKLFKRTAGNWTTVLERENAIPFIKGVPLNIVPVSDVEKAEQEDEEGPKEEETKEFTCEYCGDTFKTERGLSIHVSKKHAN